MIKIQNINYYIKRYCAEKRLEARVPKQTVILLEIIPEEACHNRSNLLNGKIARLLVNYSTILSFLGSITNITLIGF